MTTAVNTEFPHAPFLGEIVFFRANLSAFYNNDGVSRGDLAFKMLENEYGGDLNEENNNQDDFIDPALHDSLIVVVKNPFSDALIDCLFLSNVSDFFGEIQRLSVDSYTLVDAPAVGGNVYGIRPSFKANAAKTFVCPYYEENQFAGYVAQGLYPSRLFYTENTEALGSDAFREKDRSNINNVWQQLPSFTDRYSSKLGENEAVLSQRSLYYKRTRTDLEIIGSDVVGLENITLKELDSDYVNGTSNLENPNRLFERQVDGLDYYFFVRNAQLKIIAGDNESAGIGVDSLNYFAPHIKKLNYSTGLPDIRDKSISTTEPFPLVYNKITNVLTHGDHWNGDERELKIRRSTRDFTGGGDNDIPENFYNMQPGNDFKFPPFKSRRDVINYTRLFYNGSFSKKEISEFGYDRIYRTVLNDGAGAQTPEPGYYYKFRRLEGISFDRDDYTVDKSVNPAEHKYVKIQSTFFQNTSLQAGNNDEDQGQALDYFLKKHRGLNNNQDPNNIFLLSFDQKSSWQAADNLRLTSNLSAHGLTSFTQAYRKTNAYSHHSTTISNYFIPEIAPASGDLVDGFYTAADPLLLPDLNSTVANYRELQYIHMRSHGANNRFFAVRNVNTSIALKSYLPNNSVSNDEINLTLHSRTRPNAKLGEAISFVSLKNIGNPRTDYGMIHMESLVANGQTLKFVLGQEGGANEHVKLTGNNAAHNFLAEFQGGMMFKRVANEHIQILNTGVIDLNKGNNQRIQIGEGGNIILTNGGATVTVAGDTITVDDGTRSITIGNGDITIEGGNSNVVVNSTGAINLNGNTKIDGTLRVTGNTTLDAQLNAQTGPVNLA